MAKLSRRDTLHASAVMASSAAVAANARQAGAPAQARVEKMTATHESTNIRMPTCAAINTPGPMPVEVKEAPQLSDMVSAGSLPPLDERLPQDPPVIAVPWQESGQYGGRQHAIHDGVGGAGQEGIYSSSPIRWMDEGLGVDQGWLESWEHNEDKSEWTLHLRKGIKWSDGEPFTVDDITYWWEDMVLNEDHPEAPPDERRSGKGTLAEFIKTDDYTLVVSFDAPAPLTVERLVMWVNAAIGPCWIAPKHYLQQFQPKYNNVYSDYQEHDQMLLFQQNPDCPTLDGWEREAFGSDLCDSWGRNAYYYCVDPEGNQLPYLDGIVEIQSRDAESREAAILTGQAEFEWHQLFQLDDANTLRADEGMSRLETRFIDPGSRTGSALFFVQDYGEDRYRELFLSPAS